MNNKSNSLCQILLLLVMFVPFHLLNAQENDPVHWNFSTKKINDKTLQLRLTAIIDSPWHIYSQNLPVGGIAQPTIVRLRKNPLITFEGKTKEEGKLIEHKDEILNETLRYYEGKVEFVQKVKLKTSAITKLTGEVEYMACTEERCLPVAKKSFIVAVGEK
jgi:hypothetical protein